MKLLTGNFLHLMSYQRVSYSTARARVYTLYECQTGHLLCRSVISIPASYSAGHDIDSRLRGLSIPIEIIHSLYLQVNTGM